VRFENFLENRDGIEPVSRAERNRIDKQNILLQKINIDNKSFK